MSSRRSGGDAMKLGTCVLSVMFGLVGLTVGGALPAAGVAPAVGAARNVPAARVGKWPGVTSSNWSGYATTAPAASKFTYASATWTVPKVKKVLGFASAWVGIDGFNSDDLIQTGTNSFYANGTAFYSAWWAIVPAPETVIPSLTVSPGDTISAFVKELSATSWVMSITDVTTSQSFSITRPYAGPGTSAEWIQEAPSLGATILPISHYGEMEFSKLRVSKNAARPVKPRISFPSGAIALVQNGKRVSTPSVPTDGDSFNVAYGNKQPARP